MALSGGDREGVGVGDGVASLDPRRVQDELAVRLLSIDDGDELFDNRARTRSSFSPSDDVEGFSDVDPTEADASAGDQIPDTGSSALPANQGDDGPCVENVTQGESLGLSGTRGS